MASHDDISGALADEVLTDMADNFFGDRVRLEENIKALHKTADQLRKKEAGVYQKAAFLNYLMLTPEAARAVYRTAGIDSDIYMVEEDISNRILPAYTPSALTKKGEYVKLVLWAYETFENACGNYIRGRRTGSAGKRQFDTEEADYLLLQSMCTLINEEIDRINRRCPPSQILQVVKKFDPATQEKEHFTGGGAYYGDECMLNENMAFKHIAFSSLNVKELPEPASVDDARDDIIREARVNYSRHKDRIKEMLATVKRLCRLSAEK